MDFPSELYATDKFGVYIACSPDLMEVERKNFIAAVNAHFEEVSPDWIPDYEYWDLVDPSRRLYEQQYVRGSRFAIASWCDAEKVFHLSDVDE